MSRKIYEGKGEGISRGKEKDKVKRKEMYCWEEVRIWRKFYEAK